MDKQGLVAPVWSDAGEVPVGVVTCRPTYRLFDVEVSFGCDPAPGSPAPMQWTQLLFTEPCRFDLRPSKPSDPNAKPALPALTRVSGNKRGPGWCDE